MDFIANLATGFSVALTVTNILYCFAGVLLGTLVGVLPGIGPVTTVAMLLPFSFTLLPESKRLVVFDGGHMPATNVLMQATAGWLDKTLGPVSR